MSWTADVERHLRPLASPRKRWAGMISAITAEQVATAAEVESALVGLQQLADDPGYLCGSPRLFQPWARRDPA
jgi:hypothetical protein